MFFFFACAVLYKEFGPAVEKNFLSPTKGGYWFTIALLYMFIIYYVFCLSGEQAAPTVVGTHHAVVRGVAAGLRDVLPAQGVLVGLWP